MENQRINIKSLKKEIKIKNNIISNLQKLINQKEEEIKNLNKSLNNINNHYNMKSSYQNELMLNSNKDIKLKFVSTDSKVQTFIPCSLNDLFAAVENQLYEKYPEFREVNNTFLSLGKCILKFKTIKENGIKNGDNILLVVNNNSNDDNLSTVNNENNS